MCHVILCFVRIGSLILVHIIFLHVTLRQDVLGDSLQRVNGFLLEFSHQEHQMSLHLLMADAQGGCDLVRGTILGQEL